MTSQPAGSSTLAALTHPLDPDTFAQRCWPREPFVGHGPVQRFQQLAQLPELENVEAILRASSGHVRMWPPLEHASRAARWAEPMEALRLYREGWTVYLNEAERSVPGLIPCVRRLELELGLPHGSVATEIFASNSAAGAGAHCDFDFGFNIQLQGQKTWQLAPNTNFRDPHMSVSITEPFEPSVAAYSRGVLPREMPSAGRQEFVAEPGTVVFIPRGYWHGTRAHAPSLALTFACKGVAWSTLLTRHLELALRQREPWRAFPAAALGKPTAARRANVETLQQRLAELSGLLQELSAEALLDAWQQPPVSLFRLSAAAQPRRLPAEPGLEGFCIQLQATGGGERLLYIPAEHAQIVGCVLGCDFPFSIQDLAALARCTAQQAQATVAALLEQTVLEGL